MYSLSLGYLPGEGKQGGVCASDLLPFGAATIMTIVLTGWLSHNGIIGGELAPVVVGHGAAPQEDEEHHHRRASQGSPHTRWRENDLQPLSGELPSQLTILVRRFSNGIPEDLMKGVCT